MPTLAGLLKKQFDTRPEQAAVILQFAGQQDLPVTYRQLLEQAAGYARLYRQQGLQPGEVVILILEHGAELLYAFYGAILYGAVPAIMPFLTEKLSPEKYREDLASLVKITRPQAILTVAEFRPEVQAAVEEAGQACILLETGQHPGAVTPVETADLPGLGQPPQAITLLQHSSGSTGLQKGVALSHQAVLNHLTAYSKAIDLREADVFVSWLPLYHDMGLIAGFILPILSGNTLVLMSPFDWVRAPQRLMQAVSQYRGTLTWLPNFAYNFCAQKIRDRHLEGVDLSSWRAVINCSEPVRWESHQLFYEKFSAYGLKPGVLQTCYAMAENVFGVSQSSLQNGPVMEEIDREAFVQQHVARLAIDGQPAMRMFSSGQAIENTQVQIVDEQGRVLPERQVGEIALRSDSMLTEYYHRPDATEKAFQDGWYLTGDYGYLAGGELFVTGRKKDMMIIGGKNVYPQDIESLVNQVQGIHPGRVVAFGVFDEAAGTEEVVVLAETEETDETRLQQIAQEIRQHVTKNSAVALRLVQLVPPKWLHKTSSGKIARTANKEKYLLQ